jgi:D-aspartate ligase
MTNTFNGQRSHSFARARAVVLCADLNGLGAVRSLGIAGVPTIAVALSCEESVLRSKFGDKLVVGEAVDQEETLLKELLRIGRSQDVLIPTSDYFVGFIGRNRGLLETKFSCCIPSDKLIQLLTDKSEETRCIGNLSVPLPKTVQSLPSCPKALVAALNLPLILKPRTSEIGKKFKIKTVPVYDERDLAIWYGQYEHHLNDFVAQELIPGGDGTQWECVCVFDRQHRLISCFTFRKIRTAPPGFGVTCFARSEWNPEIAAIVERIGVGIDYTGPADFDFKYDSRDATYKYLEINPRLGMCNYFGTRCGVNCAHDSFLEAVGRHAATPIGCQLNGVMFLAAFDDLYGRAGGPRKSLRSVWSALHEYAYLPFKEVSYAYFDLADLGPWRWTTRRDCRRILTSARQKLARRLQLHALNTTNLRPRS